MAVGRTIKPEKSKVKQECFQSYDQFLVARFAQKADKRLFKISIKSFYETDSDSEIWGGWDRMGSLKFTNFL